MKKRKIRIFNFLSKIATVDMIAKISIFSSDENRFFRFFFFVMFFEKLIIKLLFLLRIKFRIFEL